MTRTVRIGRIRMMPAGLVVLIATMGVQAQTGGQPAPRERSTKPAATAASSADIDAMRKELRSLTQQISALRQDLSSRRPDDSAQFNANVARLQLVNTELDRLRRERDEVRKKLSTAQSLEDDARYRLSNVQGELMYAGGLDRQANEDRIRRSLDRQLGDAQAAAGDAQQQLSEVDLRISQTEQVAEKLRRRLKIDYTQVDNLDEDERAPASQPPPAEDEPQSDGRPD